MAISRSSYAMSLVAVGCCLIVVGSDGAGGAWKYLVHATAVALFVVAIVLELKPSPR